MERTTPNDARPQPTAGRGPAVPLRAWAAAGLVALLAACGGGGGAVDDGSGPPPVGTTEYFPLALGDRWISREGGTVGFITTRVTAVQDSGGTQAITVTQFTIDGQRQEVQLRRDAGGVYLLPAADDPVYLRSLGPLLQMKLPVREGETYTQIPATVVDLGEDLDGDGRSEMAQIASSITVVGLVPVTLPDIGTLDHVAHLRTTLTLAVTLSLSGDTQTVVTTSDDYYAPNIGPVKSVVAIEGIGQLLNEEAVGYAVGLRRSETRQPLAQMQSPVPGSTQQPDRNIEILFDEELDAYGLEIAPPVLRRADGAVAAGRFALTDGRRLTFLAEGSLASGVYTVELGPGVSDIYGNRPDLPPWTFTVDGERPRLLSSSLADGATDVPLDVEILLSFDEPVVPEAVAFTLDQAGSSGGYSLTPVLVSPDGRTVRLVRSVPLNYGTDYRLTVSPLLRDTVGNYLGTPVEIDFRTVAGRFAAAASLPMASPVVAGQVADLTGDGRGDLLVATLFGNAPGTDYRVLLYPVQPDGSFGAVRELPAGSGIGCRPFALAVADLNADGRRDVLVWRENCGLRLMTQQVDGSFGVAWDDATLRLDRVADLDGDGRPELLALDGGLVRVHRGLAGGTFGAATELSMPGVRQIDLGDVDGDGRPDLVGSGDSVVVLRQLAGGGFAAPEMLALASGQSSGGVAAGDIDGDGRADLVFSLQASSSSGDALAWRLQQADGSLGPVQTAPSPLRPSVLRLADMDGDGRLDVVLGTDTVGLLAVYLQRAGGGLAPYEVHAVPSQVFLQPGMLTVGDFSGDGRPDVLVGDTVLRQVAPVTGGARRSPQAVKRQASGSVLQAAVEALKRRGPAATGGR